MHILEFIAWVALIGSAVMYWLNSNPNINWKCRFGNHDYLYIGKKSGMVRKTNGERGVIGTVRRVYECTCGVEKPVESKDYIN